MANAAGGSARAPVRIGRRGAWSTVAIVLGAGLAVPALAAGEAPGGGSGDLVWVYDAGVGRTGGWQWDEGARRWVLKEVREEGSPGSTPAPVPRGAADRPSFFVDCQGGDDAAAGTQAAPWRTPGSLARRTLPARAVVYLKRGCTWDGQVRIAGDGIALAPYGEGDPPTITAKDAPREEGAVVVDSPRGLVTGLRVRDTAGAGIWLAAQGAAASDSLVENVAFGVKFTAPHTIADRVAARDLHLYTSTPKSEKADDDSGAVGFNVESTDVTVQNSSCVNCRAPSDDYGHDGGFIEIWREGDRLRAFNNVGYNVDGFLEIGGMKGSGDAVQDVLLQGNKVSRVYERALYINQGGPYDIPVTGLVMRDNVMQLASGSAAAGDTSGVDIDDSNRIGRDVPPPVATPDAPANPARPEQSAGDEAMRPLGRD